ncbi:acyl-CoA N-acyltransferase [Xylaria sp. FL1042]|nr:acyl-CoA N-acyltransferase [Xylaria sp. FL1042]
MAETSDTVNTITYREASLQDLDSLETIIPRSFFPVNEHIKTMFPDTPAIRAWWRGIFEEYIRNPAFYLPVAVDTVTNVIVGAAPFRGVQQGQPFGGFMAQHPATPDHPAERWQRAIQTFIENEERTVGDRDRFLIEILGVDHAYQGRGIGKQLVARLCEIADLKGHPIFLETSQAREFYLKQGRGFEVASPDGKGVILLRQPTGKGN